MFNFQTDPEEVHAANVYTSFIESIKNTFSINTEKHSSHEDDWYRFSRYLNVNCGWLVTKTKNIVNVETSAFSAREVRALLSLQDDDKTFTKLSVAENKELLAKYKNAFIKKHNINDDDVQITQSISLSTLEVLRFSIDITHMSGKKLALISLLLKESNFPPKATNTSCYSL